MVIFNLGRVLTDHDFNFCALVSGVYMKSRKNDLKLSLSEMFEEFSLMTSKQFLI